MTQVMLISGFSQSKNDYLIKVFTGKYDERGVSSGYINLLGDTIVPIGKYFYCFTDTLKNFAIVQKQNGQLVGIDKNDTELFEIYWFDNGPDDISEGLFRIIKNGKIGYADTIGKIVIEPQFDCAFPFEKGKARVSKDCKSVKDGEHFMWMSDNWIYIDKKGQIIK
jgi:hypothetical protein